MKYTQQLKKKLIISFRFSLICQAMVLIIFIPLDISRHNWPMVEATVLKSDHIYKCTPPESGKCRPIAHIEYAYKAEDADKNSESYTNFINFKASFIKSLESQENSVEAYREKYPVGKRFKIHYRKGAPEKSDIQPFMSISEWINLTLFIIFASFTFRLTKFTKEKYQSVKYDFLIAAIVVTALASAMIITKIIDFMYVK